MIKRVATNRVIKNNKGITLIALIVTIVVMIALATVAVKLAIGDNGIISRAQESAIKTRLANLKQQMQDEIMTQVTENRGDISDEELKSILEKYGTINYENGANKIKSITTDDGQEIPISEVFTGTTKKELALRDTSYLGYYADVDGDGNVDGVIYADLIFGATKEVKQWTNSHGIYDITPLSDSSKAKDYYISKKNYSDKFGVKDVLAPNGSGEDRFYVMSLKDFGNGYNFNWYNSAYDNGMEDYKTATSGDFGSGKDNTDTMIAKWNAGEYGEQNTNGTYKDMWGVIQDDVKKGWFVPSRGEWAAFANELDIDAGNCAEKGVDKFYWSSSQSDYKYAWRIVFDVSNIQELHACNSDSIRLGTRF